MKDLLQEYIIKILMNIRAGAKEKILKNIKFLDIPVILIVIVSSIIMIASAKNTGSQDKIQVSANGKEYVYSLSKDQTYTFEGPLGITTVQVLDGKAKITDSPCPNKTCMKSGSGRTLVCLPNKVIVTVIQQKEVFDVIVE